VQTIASAARHWSLSTAQIAAEYDLAEARVRECLAFYAAHREELDAAIAAESALARADA
jgi:uncharacterized protein (DUF433 family)